MSLRLSTLRRIKYIALLGMIFTFICGCVQPEQNPINNKAMWAWHPEEDIQTNNAREELVAFAEEKGINTVYLYIGDHEDTTYLQLYHEQYRSFIQLAHQHDIKVYALDGSPEWGIDHLTAIEKIHQVFIFNDHSERKQQFDGIQFDIEPYLLEEWDSDEKDQLIGDFLAGLKEYEHTIGNNKSSPLQFMVAIPFWFDSEEYITTFDGKTKPLSEHVMDIVNSVVIMAYRDSAEGKDSITYHTEKEMIYANENGNKLVIGVETKQIDPYKITFFEEGEGYMDQQLEIIEKVYQKQPGYEGVAIHHYKSYKKMKP